MLKNKKYLEFIIDSSDMQINMQPKKLLVLKELVSSCFTQETKKSKFKHYYHGYSDLRRPPNKFCKIRLSSVRKSGET